MSRFFARKSFFAASLSLVVLGGGLPAWAGPAQAQAKPGAAHGPAQPQAKPGAQHGQRQWAAALEAALVTCDAGNLADAEAKVRAALALAEKEGEAKGVVDCLEALADVLDREKKLEESESVRRRALAAAVAQGGQTGLMAAEAAAALASTLALRGQIAEAEGLLDSAQSIIEQAGGDGALAQASWQMATARVRVAKRVPGLAIEPVKSALSLRESRLGEKNRLVLATLEEYASLLESVERGDEARKIRERVTLARATSPGQALTPSGASGQFKQSIERAKAAQAKGDRAAAMAAWKAVVADAEAKGASDPRLAYALFHLAEQYYLNKDTAEAEALYKKAVAVREKASAVETLAMARNLMRLSALSMARQDYAQSQALLSRALSIEDKCGAPDAMVASTLQYLASAAMVTKNNAVAESAARRLLALSEKMQTPAAAMKKSSALGVLGGLYMQSGRMEEGMRMLKQVSTGMQAGGDTQAYAQAFQDEYAAIDKAVDASEEKALGI